MNYIMVRLSLLLLLALLLAGCGGSPLSPNEREAIESQPAATSAPTATVALRVRGERLPGKLLFVQGGNIWKWQGDGAAPIIEGGVAWQPAWAPDGSRLVYIERGDSYSDVMLAAPDGTHLAQLTFNGSREPIGTAGRVRDSSWSFYPAFTPDGSEIVMAAQAAPPSGTPAVEDNLALFSLPVTGGDRQPLLAEGAAQLSRAIFTPDGAALIYSYAATSAESGLQLYRFDMASELATPLPGAPPLSYDPAITKDGNWLAFATYDGAGTDIFGLPISGGNPVRLTSLGAARTPAFAPDGSKIAFLAIPQGGTGFELFVADLSRDENGTLRAGEPRQITRDMGLDADSGVTWAE